MKYGLDELLPAGLELVHGPGCPVCVTPLEQLDRALAIAATPGVIFCSFGDMRRVPGSRGNLFSVMDAGGDVRIVYSPLDAVTDRVQGFLAAGHVCTVMGVSAYAPLAARYRVPIIVTGFEPLDILQGIALCVRQLEDGRCDVENPYARAVRPEGNLIARDLIAEVFEVVPRAWRGIGAIPASGLGLRAPYDAYDAERRFAVADCRATEPAECVSGLIMQGALKPVDCAAFGTRCTPEHPLGAPMVSSEGACGAYYRYRKERT